VASPIPRTDSALLAEARAGRGKAASRDPWRGAWVIHDPTLDSPSIGVEMEPEEQLAGYGAPKQRRWSRWRVASIPITAVFSLAFILFGWVLWGRSRESCEFAKTVVMRAGSAGRNMLAAHDDDLVLRLVDRAALTAPMQARVRTAEGVLKRTPNWHLSDEALEWLSDLAGAAGDIDRAKLLLQAPPVDDREHYQCSLPARETAASQPSDSERPDDSPGRLFARLEFLDASATRAVADAQERARVQRAEEEARRLASLARLRAEMELDANGICRNRAIVSQAGARYEQFLAICNGSSGGYYSDCTQYQANMMASEVRGLATQRDRNEDDFATKWGSAALSTVSCF
jgi:hypothetical protein